MSFFFKNSLLFFLLSFSLIVRIFFLIYYPDTNFPDAQAYETIGNEIFAGKLITNNIYMPLYPVLTYLSGGGVSKNLVDIILSVVMIAVIYKLSNELFHSKTSAITAVIISTIYPHFVFYSISGLTETFFTLMLLLSFLLFYKEKYIPAIVILILSILIRPSLDFLNIFLVIIFTFFVFRRGYLKTFQQCLIYVLLYVILMTPWWVHQYEKYGEFVRLNLGDVIVLFSGNNPANTTGGGVGRYSGKSDMDLSQFYNIKSPVQRNKAMKTAAIDYIFANPGDFVQLSGKKFVRLWRLWPHTEFYQQWYIIGSSLLSYGLILFLAIGFIIQYSKKYFRKLLPIYALFAYLTLVHMLTIGSIRYRFPLEPFLIIFASQFLTTFFKNKSWFIRLKDKIGINK